MSNNSLALWSEISC